MQLIELHASAKLSVLCLGFAPGLAYLAELPEEFSIPRRAAHGRPFPAGSLLVANRQTVLPATPIPTGWRSIGATPLPTFLPRGRHPFLLSPGDSVRFEPVTDAQAEQFDPARIWGHAQLCPALKSSGCRRVRPFRMRAGRAFGGSV